MYYDDEGRRFNVLSGLLFGTLLGAGIALLAAPAKRRVAGGPAGKRRPPARSGKKAAARTGGDGSLKAKVLEAVAASVLDAWKRSR